MSCHAMGVEYDLQLGGRRLAMGYHHLVSKCVSKLETYRNVVHNMF